MRLFHVLVGVLVAGLAGGPVWGVCLTGCGPESAGAQRPCHEDASPAPLHLQSKTVCAHYGDPAWTDLALRSLAPVRSFVALPPVLSDAPVLVLSRMYCASASTTTVFPHLPPVVPLRV